MVFVAAATEESERYKVYSMWSWEAEPCRVSMSMVGYCEWISVNRSGDAIMQYHSTKQFDRGNSSNCHDLVKKRRCLSFYV